MDRSSVRSHTPVGRVPDGVRIYAIGDIHGCVDLLDQVLTAIDIHLASNPILEPIHVFLGDYVDRGPASRSVLDRLIGRSRRHATIFLKGNHEVFLTDFLINPFNLDEWRKYGGLETLMSYGLKPPAMITANQYVELAGELERALPQSHRDFLFELKMFFVCGDYFFVHAGVRPGITLAQQDEQDLLWIREDFLKYQKNYEKIIVHGHTPVPQPEIHSNRINIDTGAYATGNLTCLVLESGSIEFL